MGPGSPTRAGRKLAALREYCNKEKGAWKDETVLYRVTVRGEEKVKV